MSCHPVSRLKIDSQLQEDAMLTSLLLAISLSLAGSPQAPTNEDPLKINDEMIRFLNENVDHSSDRFLELQSLVRKLFQENALHFTYVQETRTAIDTFEKRGGNCVSFTILFIALARQLGMDAKFREVSIVPTWSKIGNVVTMHGHANAAVFIGGEGYVVDLFPRVDRIQLGGRVVSDGRAIAHFYNNKGVDHLGAGRYATAIEWFQKALESDPTSTFAWANLGVAQAFAGRLNEAENSYRQAIQLDAGELTAMSNLASLYERMGRFREAKSYKAKVKKFNLRNPYYHFDLGLQAFSAGDYRESIVHYKAALKLKSVEHNFCLAMAKSYAQLGQWDKASEYLKLAAKNAPDQLAKSRYNEKLAVLASRLHGS